MPVGPWGHGKVAPQVLADATDIQFSCLLLKSLGRGPTEQPFGAGSGLLLTCTLVDT